MTKILIIGASGMLGSTLLKYFTEKSNSYKCYGTVRSSNALHDIKWIDQSNIFEGVSAEELRKVEKIFYQIKPDFVINCIGIIKQVKEANNALDCIRINSLFPHELAKICGNYDAKLIHFSTDCVFSGNEGFYKESDEPDAQDLYGLTKRIGEVKYSNSITLRTSIIGHELNSNKSLLDWFLSQKGKIDGYKKAIFSGMPTIEIAKVIDEFVIPNNNINGLFNLSADPIDKFTLLSIVKEVYKKEIEINPNYDYKIDRSLDSSLFRAETGFKPKSWDVLIQEMYEYNKK